MTRQAPGWLADAPGRSAVGSDRLGGLALRPRRRAALRERARRWVRRTVSLSPTMHFGVFRSRNGKRAYFTGEWCQNFSRRGVHRADMPAPVLEHRTYRRVNRKHHSFRLARRHTPRAPRRYAACALVPSLPFQLVTFVVYTVRARLNGTLKRFLGISRSKSVPYGVFVCGPAGRFTAQNGAFPLRRGQNYRAMLFSVAAVYTARCFGPSRRGRWGH